MVISKSNSTYIHTAGLDTKRIVIGTDIFHRIQILDKPWTKPYPDTIRQTEVTIPVFRIVYYRGEIEDRIAYHRRIGGNIDPRILGVCNYSTGFFFVPFAVEPVAGDLEPCRITNPCSVDRKSVV